MLISIIRILKYLLFYLLFIAQCSLLSAQDSDFQIWNSISLEKKITSKTSVTISEELRFVENISQFGQYFFEAELSHKISKFWHISGSYRFTDKMENKNRQSSIRHRYFFDLSYRRKYEKFLFTFRTRYQTQYKNLYSSDKVMRAEYYSRNKFSIRYNFHKIYKPFISVEAFIPLNSQYNTNFDEIRYTAGLNFDINKRNSIETFYIIRKEYNIIEPQTDYILGLEYKFRF